MRKSTPIKTLKTAKNTVKNHIKIPKLSLTNNKSKSIIDLYSKSLRESDLSDLEIINMLAENIDFKDLSNYLLLNPLVIKVSTLIDSVFNLDFYTVEDIGDPIPKPRVIAFKNNRLRISFKAIDKEGITCTKKIEFGILCDQSGKSYTDLEVKTLIKEESVNVEDMYVKFNLNYYFKTYISKYIINIKINDSQVTEEDLEQTFTLEDYLNTSKSQFNYVLPNEITVLTNLRRFIYDNCMKYAKSLAYNYATNSCRHSGELDQSIYNVSNQKYGGVFLCDEYFRTKNFDQRFKECGLEEREIALIKELMTNTYLYGYRTQTFSMTDKSNFSISGYSSPSTTTDLASYFSKEDLISKVSSMIMNLYLEEAIQTGKKINVLLDSTIIFTDGTSLNQNKDTYSNTKGFGKGIKAIMLVTEQGFPLIFNVVNGNEPDVTTISQILDKLELYCKVPKNQLTIVCDAGYFSKSNMLYIINKGYDINVVGKEINLTKDLIKKTTEAHFILSKETTYREMYLDIDIPLTKYITKADITNYAKSNPHENLDLAKLYSTNIKVVLLHNVDLKADELSLFNESIQTFITTFEKTKDKTKLLKHSFITKHKYFKVATEQDESLKLVPNINTINEKLHRLGTNSIFSTLHDYSCREIVEVYKSRINIEVLFKLSKQLLGLNAVRVHKDYSLQLKILVVQLTIGMINELSNKIYRPDLKDLPVAEADYKKLTKEYPSIFKLLTFIHSDLSFEKVNNCISYKKMNKTTRVALSLLNYKNPIDNDFVKTT